MLKLKKVFITGIFLLMAVSSIVFALPDTVTLTVDRDGTPYTFQLERASVRTSDAKFYTWDATNDIVPISPDPEVRTYRGTVDEEANTLILAWIKTDGTLVYSGFNPEWGKGWYWTGSDDVSSQLVSPIEPVIAPQTTGTGETFLRTVAAGVDAPHTYFPPTGGMRLCEMVMDMPKFVYNRYNNIDDAQGRIEYYTMTYSFTNARDTLVETQLAASCINIEDYYPNNGGYTHTPLRDRWWGSDSGLCPDYDMAHMMDAIWSAFSNTAGGAWATSGGAIYHEGSHNWNAGHLAYEADSQWGNKPFNGAFNIDKILKRRSDAIASFPARPTDYPWPLHPFTHPDLAATSVNTSIDINVLANDWDGNDDDLSVVNLVTSDGTVQNLGSGIVRYTPSTDYVGKAMIVYTIEDNSPLTLRSSDIIHVEVINHGLTVHYEFEEASGTVVSDSSGVGYNGLLTDGGDFSIDSFPGPLGNAVRARGGWQPQGAGYTGIIVGSGSILPVGTTDNKDNSPFDTDWNVNSGFYDPMGESYTLACWFKAVSFDQGDVKIAEKQGFPEHIVGFRFTASPSGLYLAANAIEGSLARFNTSGSTSLSADRWYHVAMVIDRSTDDVRLYLNGNLDGENTTGLDAGAFIFNGRAPLRLGESSSDQLCVDDFRVYTKALTQPEVQALYGMPGIGIPRFFEDLVEYTAYGNEAFEQNLMGIIWDGGDDGMTYEVVSGPAWLDITTQGVLFGYPAPSDAGLDIAVVRITDGDGVDWDELTVNIDVFSGDVNSGLTGHWKLDDASGTVATDASGNGYDGTLLNGPVWASGPEGGALAFDGVNDWVQVDSQVPFGGDYSLSVWFQTTASSGDLDLIALTSSGNHGILLEVGSDGKLRALHRYPLGNSGGTNLYSPGVINDGVWHLLTFVNSGTDLRMYIDGASATSGAVSSQFPLSNWEIVFGRLKVSISDRYFNGSLDDVRLYDRALSDGEVATLYGNNSAPTAVNDSDGMLQDSSAVIDVLANDSDPDAGDTLGVMSVTQGTNGTVVNDFYNVIYTPNPGFSGSDSFTYTVNDGKGGTDVATVNITVCTLEAHWQFDDGSGTSAVDSTGNGHTGTITGATWITGHVGGALDFTAASSNIVDIPATAFANVNSEVTVAMWVNGDAVIQPSAGTVFYAADAAGNRVLNIHLPWSNSEVYWDAGNSGTSSYDRISKTATSYEFEGQWNHWVFTKDATTGDMKIYLNGAIWYSGTGKTRTMSGIASASIGGKSGSYYDGGIDDVQVYSVALNDTEVSDLYNSAPAAPTGLVATPGDAVVTLNWDDNTEPDLASYSVYRSTTSGSGYASVATGLATSDYVDNTVTNGIPYYYVVTAVDTSSNESDHSNQAFAWPHLGGDINRNGFVDFVDFALFSSKWLDMDCSDSTPCGRTDIDGDNDVDFDDLLELAGDWLY